jgi:thiol:disulfide interchange protein DsbC
MRTMRWLPWLALWAALPAWADEAAIRQMVESKLGGARVQSVLPTPVPGIFEVQYSGADGPRIVYTDAQAKHIFVGELIDAASERNLTEERLRRVSAIDLAALPYDLAVKVRSGSGRHSLVVFSDPYCPACFRFEKTLAKLDDVTIFYFIYPVIRPELVAHSRAAWCAPDRAKAWLDLARRHIAPPAVAKCEAPIDKVLALGHKLGIRSTPTIFLADGERLRGGPSLAQLRVLMDEAAARSK